MCPFLNLLHPACVPMHCPVTAFACTYIQACFLLLNLVCIEIHPRIPATDLEYKILRLYLGMEDGWLSNADAATWTPGPSRQDVDRCLLISILLRRGVVLGHKSKFGYTRFYFMINVSYLYMYNFLQFKNCIHCPFMDQIVERLASRGCNPLPLEHTCPW